MIKRYSPRRSQQRTPKFESQANKEVFTDARGIPEYCISKSRGKKYSKKEEAVISGENAA